MRPDPVAIVGHVEDHAHREMVLAVHMTLAATLVAATLQPDTTPPLPGTITGPYASLQLATSTDLGPAAGDRVQLVAGLHADYEAEPP